MMKMLRVCVTLGLLLLVGCSNRRAEEAFLGRPSEKQDDAPSSASTVIDGLTGRSSIKHGKQATEKIRQISNNRNRELEEVLNE
ncbi:MAG: hypothetical protein N2255_09390 [Kiritimatiellae bacterium]|nr:hypothetical protein [Kiritimatiellia bacterium]